MRTVTQMKAISILYSSQILENLWYSWSNVELVDRNTYKYKKSFEKYLCICASSDEGVLISHVGRKVVDSVFCYTENLKSSLKQKVDCNIYYQSSLIILSVDMRREGSRNVLQSSRILKMRGEVLSRRCSIFSQFKLQVPKRVSREDR